MYAFDYTSWSWKKDHRNPPYFPSLQYLCIKQLWKKKHVHRNYKHSSCPSCFYSSYRIMANLFSVKGASRLFGPNWEKNKIQRFSLIYYHSNLFADIQDDRIVFEFRFNSEYLHIFMNFLYFHVLHDYKAVPKQSYSRIHDMLGLACKKDREETFLSTKAIYRILQKDRVRYKEPYVIHDDYVNYVPILYNNGCPQFPCQIHDNHSLNMNSSAFILKKISNTKIKKNIEIMYVKSFKMDYHMTWFDYKLHCKLRNYNIHEDFYFALLRKYEKIWEESSYDNKPPNLIQLLDFELPRRFLR